MKVLSILPLAIIAKLTTALISPCKDDKKVAGAMDCLTDYAHNGNCDWDNWTDMENTCHLTDAGIDRYLIPIVQSDECTWDNWTVGVVQPLFDYFLRDCDDEPDKVNYWSIPCEVESPEQRFRLKKTKKGRVITKNCRFLDKIKKKRKRKLCSKRNKKSARFLCPVTCELCYEEDLPQWENEGRGLELVIQHSLTNNWDAIFANVVADWNEAPALSLTTENIGVGPNPNDPEDCTQATGMMKICNGFYGSMGWDSMSMIRMTADKKIYVSVVLMNDSYLRYKSEAEKQNGLGFGLNRQYYNETADPNLYTGSCLDLLENPNPTRPDPIVDFDSLLDLYGEIEMQERHLGKKAVAVTDINADTDVNANGYYNDGVDVPNTNSPPSTKQHLTSPYVYTQEGQVEGLGRMRIQTKHYEIYENILDGNGDGDGDGDSSDGGSGDRLVTIVYLHQEETSSTSYFQSFMDWLTHSLHY